MIFQNFQANFSKFVAIFLQAGKNAKRVRNGVPTKFGRVRCTGGLLIGRSLEKIECTRWRFVFGCKRHTPENLQDG